MDKKAGKFKLKYLKTKIRVPKTLELVFDEIDVVPEKEKENDM